MTYLLAVLVLALIGAAVTIYRLSGEIRALGHIIDGYEVANNYLRERNRDLNAELLTMSVKTTTYGTSVPATLTLPSENPQKRPKSIRGKRK